MYFLKNGVKGKDIKTNYIMHECVLDDCQKDLKSDMVYNNYNLYQNIFLAEYNSIGVFLFVYIFTRNYT